MSKFPILDTLPKDVNIPIIPHRYDSSVLLESMYVITDRIVCPASLPYLLHLNEGRKKRLLHGNRNKPAWVSAAWSSKARSDTQGENPDYNQPLRLLEQKKTKELRRFLSDYNLNSGFEKFFFSAEYLHPTSFNKLLTLLIIYCLNNYTPVYEDDCKSSAQSKSDELRELILRHAKFREIEQKTIDRILKIDFSDCVKAAKALLDLVPEAREKRERKPAAADDQASEKKAASDMDPLLKQYCDLYDKLHPHNAPRNENSLRRSILAADEMLEFIDQNQWHLCHDLLPLLPKGDRHSAPLEKRVCGKEPHEKPLIYAEYLIQRINLYYQYARVVLEKEQESADALRRLLCRAFDDAHLVQRIAFDRQVGEEALLNLTAPKDDPRLGSSGRICTTLLKKSFFSVITYHCLSAIHFGSCDLNELVTAHMSLAVNALHSAACCSGRDCAEYTQHLEMIRSVFVDPQSPALMRLCEPRDKESLQKNALYAQQLERLDRADKPQRVIASVCVPFKTISDYDLFTPVFSGIYDSKAGRDDTHREDIQLLTFELIASGRVPLLQLPQLCDNRCMLTLMMNSSGFDRLCSEGLIALSSYGNIFKPSEYMIRALSNPSFKFSCSDYLEAEDKALRAECRKALYNALTQDGSSLHLRGTDAPLEARSEIIFLADALKKIDASFSQEHIRRYHQSPDQRSIPRRWATRPILPLPDVIEKRIDELEQDDFDHEIAGRSELLEAFRVIQQRMRAAGCTTRSDYELEISLFRKEKCFPLDVIRRFRKLTDYSYLLSNGLRSCDTIFTSESDPMLHLHNRITPEDFRLGPNAATIKYVFDEFRSDTLSSRTLLNGYDMVRLSEEIRRIMRRSASSPDKAAFLLEQSLNIGYTLTPSRRPMAVSFNARTDENKNCSISDTPVKDAVRKGIEINE